MYEDNPSTALELVEFIGRFVAQRNDILGKKRTQNSTSYVAAVDNAANDNATDDMDDGAASRQDRQ